MAPRENIDHTVAVVVTPLRAPRSAAAHERSHEAEAEFGISRERLQARLAGRVVATVLPEDLPALHVDGALMIQVLVNLLENAAKHTPPGTGITIRAAREDGFVRVDVEDQGPGLPAGDPERLFEKFQRGHEESNTGGAGLGLSICRAIVQAHGGRIFAVTRPEGGATFSFTMPTA